MKITKYLLLTLFILTFKFGHSQTLVDTLYIKPNPFTTSTTIHFDIASNDTISLNVFDVVGRNVMTLYNKAILPLGSYTILFSRDTLHDGMYFLLLQLGTTKSKTIKIIIESSSTGVNQLTAHSDNIIFPNPTCDMLTTSIDGMKTIVVTNLLGQICKSFKTDAKSISVSDLTAGNYIINIFNQDNELLTTQKFIKD